MGLPRQVEAEFFKRGDCGRLGKASSMPAAGILKYAYLAYLAKPVADRAVYRLMKREQVCRIVELGIGSLSRVANLVATAQRFSPEGEIHYSAIDWFDMRPVGLAPLKLIEAHRVLKATGARIRLLPGNPGHTLRDVANSLQKTDLILINSAVTETDFASAWFYLPRMCHAGTSILWASEQAEGVAYRTISFAEIAEHSANVKLSRAA